MTTPTEERIYLSGRYYHGDEAMEWADVTLDCRFNYRKDEALLHEFPNPGVPSKNNGVFRLPAERGYADDHPTMGTTTVSWHPLTGDPDSIAFAVKVTYGDGWSAAFVDGGDPRSTQQVERMYSNYLSDNMDGFAHLIACGNEPRGLHPGPDILIPGRLSVQGFRRAMSDAEAWLRGGRLNTSGPAHANELVTWSSVGLPDLGAAQSFTRDLLGRDEALDAHQAGFNLRGPATRDWVVAAARGRWQDTHDEGWRELRRLHQEGWTASGAGALHRQSGLMTATPRTAWNNLSHAEPWIRLLGDAQTASAYIDAGLGYTEARDLISAETPPDEDTLAMMAALRTVPMS